MSDEWTAIQAEIAERDECPCNNGPAECDDCRRVYAKRNAYIARGLPRQTRQITPQQLQRELAQTLAMYPNLLIDLAVKPNRFRKENH